MKCGSYVIKKKTKRGEKVVIILGPAFIEKFRIPRLNKPGQPNYRDSWPEFNLDQIDPCDGDVIASVKAVDEPDYVSDHYAELRVEYKCNKCGNTLYEELPNDSDSLSLFLTQVVAGISESKRSKLVQAFKKKADEKEEHLRQILSGMGKILSGAKK